MRPMSEWKWLQWVEPFGPNNEPVFMCVSAETAIAFQRALHPYESDVTALEDFAVVHWCTEAKEPTNDAA